MTQHIAFDIGAESGRATVGKVEHGTIRLEEAYRFANGAVRTVTGLHWDPLHIFQEMKVALRKIAQQYGPDFASIGVDTWGIDFALLDRAGGLVGNPYCYRDARTEGMMDEAFKRVARQEIFEQSGGIQFLSINSLYQMLSMAINHSPQLEIADTLLMIPDLFNYWLTGVKACEFTDATSTQFYDSRKGDWSWELLKKLGIPSHFLPKVTKPLTQIGTLLPDIAAETGLKTTPVIAIAGHDTASAAAAIPAQGTRFAWLSSGTWSLLGGVSDTPLVTPEALQFNFSSYGGPDGRFLPWKNIMGLWLVQECRRVWANRSHELSYEELTRLANQAAPFVALIEPDHASFLAPADMPAAIQAFCQSTGQTVPQTEGAILRTALESLALKYRWTLEKLEILLKQKFEALYVVGGGSQNQLLCQFTADALQRPVIAGPAEATALGNIAGQAVATGSLSSLEEARQIIRRAVNAVTYTPGSEQGWDQAYQRFENFMN